MQPSVNETKDEGEKRIGRPPKGLYPDVSRTMLSKATGQNLSVLVQVLRGRSRVTVNKAVKIAQAIGIPVEQLSRDLDRKQAEYRKTQKRKKKR